MCRGSARAFGRPLAVAMFCSLAPALFQARAASQRSLSGDSNPALNWQTSARWVHGLKRTPGILLFTESDIEFRLRQAPSLRWPFEEVQTFDLSPRRLRLTGYENRKWHRHGERSFEFDLESPVPPLAAAELARRVGKPAENGDPDPRAPAFATLPARHRTLGGGTNGVLRFRETGIDYVTRSGEGARSWRWADIQTLANPDPYHFRVGAYRETFEFELKERMQPELFDRLWNDVYARGLSGLEAKGGVQP
jgi:hypothetical protein